MRKICAKFVLRGLREEKKERRCHDSREMVELINSDSTVLDALVTCDENWIYCYDPKTMRLSCQWSMLAFPDPRRPDRENPPANFWWSLFFWQHWHDLHALGSQWTDSQQGILCWGFKGVQEEIPSEESALLKSGHWHFHQDHALVHNSILITDYLTKMGIKTVFQPPFSPDLAPCDFWLFPKLEENLKGCRYETI